MKTPAGETPYSTFKNKSMNLREKPAPNAFRTSHTTIILAPKMFGTGSPLNLPSFGPPPSSSAASAEATSGSKASRRPSELRFASTSPGALPKTNLERMCRGLNLFGARLRQGFEVQISSLMAQLTGNGSSGYSGSERNKCTDVRSTLIAGRESFSKTNKQVRSDDGMSLKETWNCLTSMKCVSLKSDVMILILEAQCAFSSSCAIGYVSCTKPAGSWWKSLKVKFFGLKTFCWSGELGSLNTIRLMSFNLIS
mmetsp:Transcript_26990/g.89570  ORF Transcript_26990/g.89570 Transcript_26990/m.89570 type:complete len:253 (+) Transcript_26990:1093-1851(+)